MAPSRRIGFISTRFAGTDGVSLETTKWATVMEQMDHKCYYFSGLSDRPAEISYVVPEAFYRHPTIDAINQNVYAGTWGQLHEGRITHPEIEELHQDFFSVYIRPARISKQVQELKDYLKEQLYKFVYQFRLEALVVENALTIPLNLPLGLALTMKDVERKDKRRLGKLADLRKAVAEVLEFRSYPFEVRIDDTVTRFRASELMVANTSILGLKSLRLDQSIRMDDGKLNVCRIYANTVTEYLKLGWSMFRGDQERNWNVLCVEASREVEIRTPKRMPVQGDGELIGQLPITVKIRPKAIQIVTPPHAEPV